MRTAVALFGAVGMGTGIGILLGLGAGVAAVLLSDDPDAGMALVGTLPLGAGLGAIGGAIWGWWQQRGQP